MSAFVAVAGIVLSAALLVACNGCDGETPSAVPAATAASPPPPPDLPPRVSTKAKAGSDAGAAEIAASELTWKWDATPVGPMQVVISLPARRAGEKFPVLITMHGRGEAFKGPEKGARGWIDDYWMSRAIERLRRPPLSAEDLLEIADDDRLARLNAALAARPYRGLIVVCPYTPDILQGDRPFSAAVPLAKFLVDELLPRVRRETPAIATAKATGIDGVSLGGRASLLVGLERPEAFGAIEGLQAAFDSADAPELARLAKAAKVKHPELSLRLLTSTRDFFLNANRSISRALSNEGVAHVLTVLPGPHDYEFNRGPAVYEMLYFHDRVLRGEPALDTPQ